MCLTTRFRAEKMDHMYGQITALCALVCLAGCSRIERGHDCKTDTDCPGGYVCVEPDFTCQASGERTDFGIFPMTKTTQALTYSAERIIDLNLKRVTKFEMWNVRQATRDSSYKWGGMDNVMVDFLDATDAKMFLRITPWGLNSDGSVAWYCDTTQADKVPDEFSCVIKPEYTDDFKAYLDAITKRYSDRLTEIAFGNEWTGSHFVGDEYDYVEYANWLYEITKANSPDTTVVLGAITSNPMKYAASCKLSASDPNYLEKVYFKGQYLDDEEKQQFCQAMEGPYNKLIYALNNAKYDAVDIHLYDDYDNWDEYVNILRTLTDKPLYVSEFGGPSPNDPKRADLEYQASELRHYLDTILGLQIPKAYYFQLIETGAYHANSALIYLDENSEPVLKPTYEVFKNRYNTQ